MLGVALELADLPGVPVHVREQPAGGLAVEAGGGHQRVVLFLPRRPGPRGQLHPVVPAFLRRERGQVHPAGSLVERLAPGLGGRRARPTPGAPVSLERRPSAPSPHAERNATVRPARRRARSRAARRERRAAAAVPVHGAAIAATDENHAYPERKALTVPRVISCTASRACAVTCGCVISPATSSHVDGGRGGQDHLVRGHRPARREPGQRAAAPPPRRPARPARPGAARAAGSATGRGLWPARTGTRCRRRRPARTAARSSRVPAQPGTRCRQRGEQVRRRDAPRTRRGSPRRAPASSASGAG